MVVYLASKECKESGKLFEAGAGWYGQVKHYRSKGVVIPNASVEQGELFTNFSNVIFVLVRDNWTKITDQKGAVAYDASQGNLNIMIKNSPIFRSHRRFIASTRGGKK